jgi:hypothetical protein
VQQSWPFAAASFTVFAALFAVLFLLAALAYPALAAFTAAQRFFVASEIARLPAAESLRLGFGASTLADTGGCSDPPRIFAHLALWASLIFRNVAALNLLRLRPTVSGLAAVSVEL